MSLDTNELVRLIKRAALEAVAASAPVAVCFGTVTSAEPLKIMVDQKKILSTAQLILTSNVRNHTVKMKVQHKTDAASGGFGDAAFSSHAHDYTGEKEFEVLLGLKTGEKVILLRCDGGQKYIVLDRWEAIT